MSSEYLIFSLSVVVSVRIYNWTIGIMVRLFTIGTRDQGSITGRVIPKTQKKWHLMPLCLTLSLSLKTFDSV